MANPTFDFTGAFIPTGATLTRASTRSAVNVAGNLAFPAVDVPGWDYSPTSPYPFLGLLMEKTATNNAVYSNDFSNAAWQKQTNVNVTVNNVTSPENTLNADTIEWASASNNTGMFANPWTVNGAANVKSIYVKAAVGGGTIGIADASFGADETIVTLTTTWQRATLLSGVNAQPGNSSMWIKKKSGSPTEIHLYGAQMEFGTAASTYIPVAAGSPVARSAEIVTLNWATKGIVDGVARIKYTFDDLSTQTLVETVAGGVTVVNPALLTRTRVRTIEYLSIPQVARRVIL